MSLAPASIFCPGINTNSCAGSHLLSWNWHLLATNKAKKVEMFGSIHTLHSLPDQGEMCAKFGSDWFGKTNFSLIYKITILADGKPDLLEHVKTKDLSAQKQNAE
jgi:hypothetical protein